MLPPGPRAPAALQTYEWVARPTTLMRRAQARYGEPFTLRLAWSDAPMVFTSDPEEIKRVYAAPPDELRAGASSTFLEPFAGPRSILVLDGDEHLKERRLMLPPFHGEALARWRDDDGARAPRTSWRAGSRAGRCRRSSACRRSRSRSSCASCSAAATRGCATRSAARCRCRCRCCSP